MTNNIHALQRHCMFSMELRCPVETLQKILEMLLAHQFIPDDLQLIKLSETESKLIFHARLEMDRMRSLKIRLGKIKKISRLLCLYEYQRNKLY